MRKYLSAFTAALLALSFSACTSGEPAGNETGTAAGATAETAEQKALKIVTTIFPEYDWVNNILGENPGNAEVTLLLNNGVDLHSYQPTAADILKISECDLFIYVGGESDEWVEDALQEATNKNMKVINLLEALGDSVKIEEMVEGMQETEHDHDHEEEHEGEEDHDHEEEYDEHVWLSLRNAEAAVRNISDAVQAADPDHADIYAANTEAYIGKLEALDKEYQQAVSEASLKTLLFGDRFPFRYMTDDYGLSYYAAFVGCSAETEASFDTIIFLADKVDELSLHTILTIEGTNHRIAETIRDNTAGKDQQILVMDSLQSATSKDAEAGVTYLSVMEKNLQVLKEALK